ncbi:uncharacterized protein LOC119488923 [Sebastes umbrosus]|uniref:uncharacterized protein LOC119488923 n=1 Tax=Sebastes umbrosus TaxID=72105 RepID=UPI00189FFA75|nr:uncharacterized protein LOC119488923 [Sebastes umbrosus]
MSLTGQAVPVHQANFNQSGPTAPLLSVNTERNTPSTSQMPPAAAPIYNLRPFTRRGPRNKRFHGQLSSSVAHPFTREVILLPDHTYTDVPRRARKAWLFENGHIKSALEFGCDWDSDKVMQAIMAAFQTIVEGCRLQILMPCHNKLLEPSLTSNQTLSGALVKKLFHQKSIYVRPDKVILSEEKESSCSDEDGSHTNSRDVSEISDTDKCANSTVEAQFLFSNTPSISSDDQVILYVATQDICTDAPSISADTFTVSTSAPVITIDETLTLSSGTSAISSGNTHGLSIGPTVNASGDTHLFSANNTSGVSHDPTQPRDPHNPFGNSSSSTSYSTYFDLFEEEYLSDDPDLQEAISRSLDASASESDLKMTSERIMERIGSRVNTDSTVRFNIIRRNVWDGACRAMARSNFSPEKKVDVKFTDDYGISEGAVDNGGPTREFFSTLST